MIDEEIKKSAKKEIIKIVRSSDHRSHYVTGAVPQWTEDDLRLHMYNEVIEGVGGPYYVASTQIILPRSAVPKIMDSLRAAVRSDGIGKQAEVSSMPLDVAISIDSEVFEKEKKGAKKKVQKIRRK
ncbi:MAG: hypothetical protein ACMUHU_04230 [Thermoplasmatota archaeon]